jgi:hypothetical protein
MANVIRGGLVGPTGAQLQQQRQQTLMQNLGLAQQAASQLEQKRQFNVGNQLALIDQASQGVANGLYGLAQTEEGSNLFKGLFDQLGVSNRQQDAFLESVRNAPPSAEAIKNFNDSLFLRFVQTSAQPGGEQQSDRLIEEYQVRFTPDGQPTAEVSPPATAQATVAEGALTIPAGEGAVVTEQIQDPYREFLAESFRADPNASLPRLFERYMNTYPDRRGAASSSHRQMIERGELDPVRGITNVEEFSTTGTRTTQEPGTEGRTVQFQLSSDMGTTAVNFSETFGTARNSAHPNAEVRTAAREENRANLPQILGSFGLPSTLDEETALNVISGIQEQVIVSAGSADPMNQINEEGVQVWNTLEPNEQLLVQQTLNRMSGQTEQPAPQAPPQQDRPTADVQIATLNETLRGDAGQVRSALSIGDGMSDRAVDRVSTNMAQAVDTYQTEGIGTARGREAAHDLVTGARTLIKASDYAAAEDDPQLASMLVNRYQQQLNDPTSLEVMASAIPASRDVLMNRAQQIRMERQLADPDSAASRRAQLEAAQLELQFQKLGLDIQKSYADLVSQSAQLGVNFADLPQEDFMKMMAFTTRLDPIANAAEIDLLQTMNNIRMDIMEEKGRNAVNDAEFQRAVNTMNTLLNSMTGTQAVQYVDQIAPGWFNQLLGNITGGFLGRREAVAVPGTPGGGQRIDTLSPEAQGILTEIQVP